MMAAKPEDLGSASALEDFYQKTAEFPAGFMTEYPAGLLVGRATHQDLATGFSLGKRFKAHPVKRVSDTNPKFLGHQHTADGRWRIYAFADAPADGAPSALDRWAEWLATAEDSPLHRHTPADGDIDAVFDVKVIYPRRFEDIDIASVPKVFRPTSGPLALTDWEKVFAAGPSAWTDADIFAEREVGQGGAVVVVRPDQYVAAVLPLTATAELADFFGGALLPVR